MNNIILTAMTLTVLWGTVLPALSEITTGSKVAVGAGFFNHVNGPFALALILLMGACPRLDWERTPFGSMVRRFAVPGLSVLVAGVLAWSLGVRAPVSLLLIAFSAFVIMTIAGTFLDDLVSRGRNSGTTPFGALWSLLSGKRRQYGAYLIHLGIIVVFLGLSGATMNREASATLHPRESMKVGKYTLRYEKMGWIPSSDRLAVKTRLKVFDAGKAIGHLTPERRFYGGREKQPTSEVAILGNWKEDLYVALTGYNRDGRASFRVLINPLVSWLWAGGYIIALGTLIVLLPGGAAIRVTSPKRVPK